MGLKGKPNATKLYFYLHRVQYNIISDFLRLSSVICLNVYKSITRYLILFSDDLGDRVTLRALDDLVPGSIPGITNLGNRIFFKLSGLDVLGSVSIEIPCTRGTRNS